MNNFLKSECYKVSHRAYPYTLLIIGVVIAILINVSVWYAIHVIRIPFTIEGADIMNAGLYMMATIVWYCIIFTTDIGFSGEWRNNTMKNIVSFGTSRNTIFFGKCIVNTLLLLIGIVVVKASLGNGYEVMYGQLKDINVSVGQVVDAGCTIGTVAEPSRYYSKEGTNLYFAITKDGKPVDPVSLIEGE